MSTEIDWMGGAVPSTWEVFKLKHVLREEKKEIGSDVPAGAISFGEVVFKNFDNDETLATYRTVRRGHFLINPLNLNYDLKSLRIGLSDIDCRVSPAYIVASNDEAVARAKYLRWALRVFDVQHIKTLGAGVRQTVRFEDIGECRIALPRLEEQEKIADNLDRATARIDTLITKKSRFIELLREKRQALISHSVTKGLRADVPMKDSGVEWLGDIPRHWKSMMLRRAIASFQQGWSPDCDARPAEVGEWGVTKSGCVNGGVFREAENKALPARFEPRPSLEILDGDVLMCRASGSPSLIGSAAYVLNPRRGLMISDKIFRLFPKPQMDRRFLVYSLGSTPLRRQIEQAIGGAEGLANNLSQESIKELWLAQPPIEEQVRIVAHLDGATSRIDTLVSKTERSIELLREHRSAQITAAVTGKTYFRKVV